MAREARPLQDRGEPELDDGGSQVERVFAGDGQVLLSCGCGCGMAWLEPADLFEAMPDPREASWERPRDLGETYWLFGATIH